MKATDTDLQFTFAHDYTSAQLARLSALRLIRLPRALRCLSWLVMAGIVLVTLALVFVPWVQTTMGPGRVTTLDPRDRVQDISALVSGRIAEWYVEDASVVKAGDPIVRIVDVDDELVSRLDSQLQAAR
ncbi:MAG: biotin/lipoyl-binding protein, partial [Pseudohongiellaceae bacterium]